MILAKFIFKLRSNITLESDLLLAKMELATYLPNDVQAVLDIAAIMQQHPSLRELKGFERLDVNIRREGVPAYAGNGPLRVLPDLIRRVTFVQRVYCIVRKTKEAETLLAKTVHTCGPVLTTHEDKDFLIITAISHYTLFELSQLVVKRSGSPDETRRNLQLMLEALLNRNTTRYAKRLASDALSARSTTSHLSHDIHYYKAKFFPRLSRSILNIWSHRSERKINRVIDSFVGSGTLLLEAATLGIPSVGIDIDPLSVLIARAKLEAVRINSDLLSWEAHKALDILHTESTGQLGLFNTCTSIDGNEFPLVFPVWLMKNRKMTPQIATELIREIQTVQRAINTCNSLQVRLLFQVLLSDAISRKMRMRFLGTGSGRFSLTFAKSSIVQLFEKSLRKYINVAATSEWLRQTIHLQYADAKVIQADARHVPSDVGKFDILITSPPYLPASSGRESYAKAHALSLRALGIATYEEIDHLINHSIGSMGGNGVSLEDLSERERKVVNWLSGDKLRSVKAGPTARYFLDMRHSFMEMRRILQPGAYCIVISGKQSTFYQFSTRQALYTVPSAIILAEEAQRSGFEVEALHDIKLVKLNRNARPRSLDDYYETLVILKNPG